MERNPMTRQRFARFALSPEGEMHAVDTRSDSAGITPNAVLIAAVVIALILGICVWCLYSFLGPGWWPVALILIAVPSFSWGIARVRDRYTRHISTEFGLSFSPGFPSIPPGSPAHGRTPWGFTGCTLSRRECCATLNLYEQSYRTTQTNGKVYHAHGFWWHFDDSLLPDFEVAVRERGLLTSMSSLMVSMLASFRGVRTSEVHFPGDPEFSARFTVRGTDDQIGRMFTRELRKALLEVVDKGTVSGKGEVLAWDAKQRLWGKREIGKVILRADSLRQAFETAAHRFR